MKRMVFLLFMLTAVIVSEGQQRVLLAVFAHSDDQTYVGPVLAKYAREGVKVYLIIATTGENGPDCTIRDACSGVRSCPNAVDRAALARTRRQEASRSCADLGIELIPFGWEHTPPLADGGLGFASLDQPIGPNTQAVFAEVKRVIDDLHPQAVVTWGPEGAYGHPDHRLVSDAVTQVIQARDTGIKLYYVGFTETRASQDLGFNPTDEKFLQVSVPYLQQDLAKHKKAFEEHVTQYCPSQFGPIEQALADAWKLSVPSTDGSVGSVSFRLWNGNQKSDDLFK